MGAQPHDSALVIVAPNAMAFRALVESDVLHILIKCDQRRIIVLSHRDVANASKKAVSSPLPEGVEWRDIEKPCAHEPSQSLWRRCLRAVSIRLSQLGLGYGNIAYRFNSINGFRTHQFKQHMAPERQQREALAGNYVQSKYGWPFPNSRGLYRLIYRCFYGAWQIPDRFVEGFFEQTKIDCIALWYVQNEIYRDYSVCIRDYGIRAVGVVGSWDRLTTKGPVCPGCECFAVNSEMMKRELVRYHGVDESLISVIGWPQMDVYKNLDLLSSRADFMASLGLNEQHQLIVFAGNSERLGKHEPSIVRHIVNEIEANRFGEHVHLLVRTHPNDHQWQQRYGHGIGLDKVTVMPAGMGDLPLLANTLKHSAMVIASQGSISLDAAAFDRHVINIGFDGDLQLDYHQSAQRYYEMDHYLPVVESGGVCVVDSFGALNDAIVEGLSGANKYAKGRQALRDLELEPLDGRASSRLAMLICGSTSDFNNGSSCVNEDGL